MGKEFNAKEAAFAARYWRETTMRLSRAALAELTGYSLATISIMEHGVNLTGGNAVKEREMRRYRMVCAAVMAGLDFDWKVCRVNPIPLTEAINRSRIAVLEDA